MINEVAAPGLTLRPYFNRYTEDAIDLCDVLSSFSSQAKATLHELCRVMGLPGSELRPKGKHPSSIALADHGDGLNLDEDLRYREILRRDQSARGESTLEELSTDLHEFIAI
jgi:hypothetical protein